MTGDTWHFCFFPSRCEKRKLRTSADIELKMDDGNMHMCRRHRFLCALGELAGGCQGWGGPCKEISCRSQSDQVMVCS